MRKRILLATVVSLTACQDPYRYVPAHYQAAPRYSVWTPQATQQELDEFSRKVAEVKQEQQIKVERDDREYHAQIRKRAQYMANMMDLGIPPTYVCIGSFCFPDW